MCFMLSTGYNKGWYEEFQECTWKICVSMCVHEVSFHYFFKCLLYIEEPQIMVNSLETYRQELTVDTLLFGTDKLEEKKNIEIVHIVQNYIKNSNRFFN